MTAFVRSLRFLLVLLLLPLMNACEKPVEVFRVGTNIWIGYESLYLAQEQGLYAMPVRMVAMPNATEVQQALRAGVLEAAAVTLDEALTMAQDGLDIKVIAVMDTSNGADVLMANPAVRSLAGLKGKRIGVESTATGVLVLHEALRAAQLSVEDIHLVHLTVDEHEKSYRSGLVDALVTFEPVRSQLRAAGAHQLFDSSRMPGQIVDVLVTTGENRARHGEALQRLVAGHFKAIERMRSEPLQAAERMTQRQGLSAPQIVEAFKGLKIPDLQENRRLLGGSPPPLLQTAQKLQELMQDHKMLGKSVAVTGLFDDSLLPQ